MVPFVIVYKKAADCQCLATLDGVTYYEDDVEMSGVFASVWSELYSKNPVAFKQLQSHPNP